MKNAIEINLEMGMPTAPKKNLINVDLAFV